MVTGDPLPELIEPDLDLIETKLVVLLEAVDLPLKISALFDQRVEIRESALSRTVCDSGQRAMGVPGQ
jgi:hypothetical protein